MNAVLKSLALAAFTASLFVVGSFAHAAPPSIHLRLSPSPGMLPVAPQTPRLGFYGHFQWGYGMVVDSVPWGTPAKRIGLESGDVIVAINGNWLRSQNDYYRALQYSGGGAIQVTVQDVRTGIVVTRVANLGGYYSGPVAYGSQPGLSIDIH